MISTPSPIVRTTYSQRRDRHWSSWPTRHVVVLILGRFRSLCLCHIVCGVKDVSAVSVSSQPMLRTTRKSNGDITSKVGDVLGLEGGEGRGARRVSASRASNLTRAVTCLNFSNLGSSFFRSGFRQCPTREALRIWELPYRSGTSIWIASEDDKGVERACFYRLIVVPAQTSQVLASV